MLSGKENIAGNKKSVLRYLLISDCPGHWTKEVRYAVALCKTLVLRTNEPTPTQLGKD